MSAKHFYYIDEENNDDDEDFEYLQDVPYSSSSIDRSSVGSIPWADDAIKQNQLDWEMVERLLSGDEELPEEPELRNEVLEWQQKFPQLLHKPITKEIISTSTSTVVKLNNSFEVDSILHLSLNSFDDNDEDEDEYKVEQFFTPKRNFTNVQSNETTIPTQQQYNKTPMQGEKFSYTINNLTQLLNNDLRISSVPLSLRERQEVTGNCRSRKYSAADRVQYRNTTTNERINALPMNSHNSAKITSTAVPIRMPPILNVLETKKRFRGTNTNRSFVQLTQIQQAKSALDTSHARRQNHMRNQSAWHIPLAVDAFGGRFCNNRNAIILPAINTQQKNENVKNPTAKTMMRMDTDRTRAITKLSLDSGSTSARSQLQYIPQRSFNYLTTTTTTPSTGRSISAAVHHPRLDVNAFYLPYSAFKFKQFK